MRARYCARAGQRSIQGHVHGVDDFTMEQKLPPSTTEILNLYLQGHSPARIGYNVRLEEGRVLFTLYQFGALSPEVRRCGPNASGMRVRLPPKRLRQGLQRRPTRSLPASQDALGGDRGSAPRLPG